LIKVFSFFILEPFAFSDKLINITRDVLLTRYSLLPYYYTLFYRNHLEGGKLIISICLGTIIKSIPFEFYEDSLPGIDAIDTQFLVGSGIIQSLKLGILVSPVLKEKATTVDAYIPVQSKWYNFYNGIQQRTGKHTLVAPLNYIPVHIR
jgi:maltase-glucoamylase